MRLLKQKIVEVWEYENIDEYLEDREIKVNNGYEAHLSVHTKNDKIVVEYKKNSR